MAGVNGMSFISLTKSNNVQFFANLGKIYTIGRYDNPREVNTLEIRTGERWTACPRAENIIV